MSLDANFTIGNLDDIPSSDVAPKGDYAIRCVGFDTKETRSGGQMLVAQMEITRGPFERKQFFNNFNIVNANPEAVRITMQQLKQWLSASGGDATGELTLGRILALEGIEVGAAVKIEAGGDYDDKNVIGRFKPLNKIQMPAPGAAAPQPQPTPAPQQGYQQPQQQPQMQQAPPQAGPNPWE